MSMTGQSTSDPCACATPHLTVTVNNVTYRAAPIEVDEAPCCDACGRHWMGPSRIVGPRSGQAFGRCGQPKSNGQPCGWVISQEPCPYHRTPEQQRLEDERQERAKQERRDAELRRQEETVERRLGLIAILSVECPHCSSPAATLCVAAGKPTRNLHRARRQLAGWTGPKEYVVEATNWFTSRVPEPDLAADPRTVLGNPLEDQTAQARERYLDEERATAQKKIHDAQRAVWLADGDNRESVLTIPCPMCEAESQVPCHKRGGWPRTGLHDARIDAAIAASKNACASA
ncbi:hypothetical protein ACFYMW_39680 [Streptomyces sp. NPDC006692]|uniref:zinc finger domain-containing protein n=1 Tax=Streptomyces sp. NPDC006692 TaxID=3364758 RepID=UPI0036BB62BB